jgi:hypothetical protein
VEALASGCKVILWDDGIIGPSVNSETFWSCVVFNFALPSKRLPFRFCDQADAKSWLDDQLMSINSIERDEVASGARRYLTVETVGGLLLDIYHDALGLSSRSTSVYFP